MYSVGIVSSGVASSGREIKSRLAPRIQGALLRPVDFILSRDTIGSDTSKIRILTQYTVSSSTTPQ